MAINYSWFFPTLDVTYNEDGLSNVVNTVHWVYTAVDGQYTANVYNTVSLSDPGQPFIEYDDLTPSIVEGWVVSTLGDEQILAMQLALADNIALQKNPVQGSLPPPWVPL